MTNYHTQSMVLNAKGEKKMKKMWLFFSKNPRFSLLLDVWLGQRLLQIASCSGKPEFFQVLCKIKLYLLILELCLFISYFLGKSQNKALATAKVITLSSSSQT